MPLNSASATLAATIPPLDLRVPEQLASATFALG